MPELVFLAFGAVVLIGAAATGAALYGWVKGRQFERAMRNVDAIREERDEVER